MTTTESPRTDATLRQLARIATPTRIGQYLVPKLWGVDPKTEKPFTYDADPWLLHAEQVICNAFLSPKQERVMLNVPPQCGKSTYAGVFLPLWILSQNPNIRIIRIAYSDDLAQEFGALVRDIIMAYGEELFGLSIDPNNANKKEWKLQGHRGGILSVGIGSTITGKSGDVILIDDVIKNMEEAASMTTKNKHWKEYFGSVRSRLQPGGMMLISATRFADDDVSGRIREYQDKLAFDGETWTVLSHPAIAEPEPEEEVEDREAWRDCLGRRIGEPLKTRFSAEDEGDQSDPANWKGSYFYKLRRNYEANGEAFTWSCLYQQQPSSATGGMFPLDKWKYCSKAERPTMAEIRRVWDLAATEGGGDWSVGTLIGRGADDNYYILDVIRKRLGANEVKSLVEMTALADTSTVRIMIERERNGAGHAVFDFYKRALLGYLVSPAEPDGSKEDRARPYSTLQQAGRVFLPLDDDGEKLPWVAEFVDEHRKMMGDGRKGRWDDQIDTTSHGINAMLSVGVSTLTEIGATIRSFGSLPGVKAPSIFDRIRRSA